MQINELKINTHEKKNYLWMGMKFFPTHIKLERGLPNPYTLLMGKNYQENF